MQTLFKNKNCIIFFFIFIMLVPSVLARPAPAVTQEAHDSETLSVVNPKIETYAINGGLKLHFHVYNSTGHLRIEGVRCFFHMYNISGGHIVEQELSKDSNGVEFDISINNNLVSKEGEYTYMTWCNDTLSHEAGFISSSIAVRSEAIDPNIDLTPVAFTIAIPLLIGLLLIIGAVSISKEQPVFKVFLFLTSLTMPLISFNIAYQALETFYSSTNILDNVAFHVGNYGILLSVFIIYYLIMFIIWASKSIAQSKDDKYEY